MCEVSNFGDCATMSTQLSNMSRRFSHSSSQGTPAICYQISCDSYSGCSDVVVEYRTRNREVAGSTHTRSTASNLEQVANPLCAQANSAFYPQRDGK